MKEKADTEQINSLIKRSWEIRRSHPKDALQLAIEARELAKKACYNEGVAFTYRNSGTAYYLLSQYKFALADLQHAIKLFKESNNKNEEATALRNIGNIYHSINNEEESLKCYFKALEITEPLNDQQGSAYNYGNIGYVYQKQKKYDSALEFMLRTKEMLTAINDELGLADVLNNIGKNYLLTGEPDEAVDYFMQSLKLAEKIKHLRGIANANTNLGNFYLTKQNYEFALMHQKEAMAAAISMGEQLLIYEIYKNLSELYEATGDFKNAYIHFRKYEEIKNEVLSSNNRLAIAAMQIQNELEKAESEREIYKLKNIELAKAKEELERLSIVASETENVILILDAEGKLEWVNDSFVRLNKLTKEDLIRERGETIYEISNNPKIREIIANCVREKKPYVYESLNLTKDGKRVWESSTLSPIFDEAGNLRKLIIIDTDVTARKNAEEIIIQKNKDIQDSINYAKKIQEAMLPSTEEIHSALKDSFIFYRPKDVVSGDFYAYADKNNKVILSAVDCTGHGVPGAFMSMIGNDLLNHIILEKSITNPGEILSELNRGIKKALKQSETAESKDGMDIALCAFDINNNKLEFSGAQRPLYLIRNKQLTEYKPDKTSIGGNTADDYQFKNYSIDLIKDDIIYIFTDGYADQFGGETGKKFMTRKFKELLLNICTQSMKEQKEKVSSTFDWWKKDYEQVDDILVMGVKI